MTEKYNYHQLKDAKEVRVLQLAAGTDEIHFTLQTVNLDTAPKYEAISYCWGGQEKTKIVYCEGKTLQITNSLFTALRQLRQSDGPRALWADAVCINQDDNDEKSSQVKLMSDIYYKASQILIWLGEDTTGLAGVKGSIDEALNLLPPTAYEGEELLKNSREYFARPTELYTEWTSISSLLDRPWFGRKWIIQEVVMAPAEVKRLMICGDIELSWPKVADIAYRRGAYGVDWPGTGLPIPNYKAPSLDTMSDNDFKAFMMMVIEHYRHHDRLTLLDLFMATSSFCCKDPRDHVYALLNIIPNATGLEPDYNASIEDVSRSFAIQTLVGDQNLKFLSLAAHKTFKCESSKTLPSWVLHLEEDIEGNHLTSYNVRPKCFSAGGSLEWPIGVSDDLCRLHVQGQVIDTIKAAVPSLGDTELSEADTIPKISSSDKEMMVTLMLKRAWLQKCRNLAAGNDWASLAPTRKRDFYKTIICEMTAMRDPAPEEVVDTVEVYIDYLFGLFTTENTTENPLSENDIAMLQSHAAMIEHSILGFASGLQFCVTEGERFGQAGKEAKAGDVFCVLRGAEVPYILRPTGRETYKLIGEGYLQGVMHREIRKNDKYRPVDIFLE
ncbi:hypothetical protein NM208_g4422 [Fusarium decemcellulare]|uniref:Uncharacterized protein n=2 Tax=Fusarium decemcellulare TaxID=57161 RepID=A0ACC1S6H8_9HYPO|nr:hypothetical protein NM208_g8117 [Fusarium decemcellulare]KAJ3541818.1 hypothetical protein NM208_g4422 [Fusarium decemcellulare]